MAAQPDHRGQAAIVGAGVVGLSVAWFLQDEGFEVTVYDRRDVAAGASAGNAGWICPAMVAPLPEPSVLRYGVKSLLRPNSPLRITPAALPVTWPFLLAFAAHSTTRQWLAGVSRYAELNALALPAFQLLADAGISASIEDSPMDAAFERADQAQPLRHELEAIARTGLQFSIDELSEADLRREQPLLAPRARYGLRVSGQKFLQPLEFVQSLAESVAERGARLVRDAEVTGVRAVAGDRVEVTAAGDSAGYDVCVLANGAWIGKLGRSVGVRTRVLAGRGYSFMVRTPEPLRRPLYLPALRVACTPAPAGMRVAGTMEFRPADDPLDGRRIAAIVRSAQDYFPAVDWSDRSREWVGPRPVTADGLPLIGRTKVDNIFAAGGHGMWGMTLGPATGQMLARYIATGECPGALVPFDPLR